MEKYVSISVLQIQLNIGLVLAGEIVEKMEKDGFISCFSDHQPRKVLLSESEYQKRYGELH